MVYKLDAGTVIDAEGNLVVENLYVDTDSVAQKTQAQGTVSGYISGGSPGNNTSNIIEKYPFSTDANSTDVGDLTVGRQGGAGQSSDAFGYTSGGKINPPYVDNSNIIDKFPFSVDGNATDVGDLSQGRMEGAGTMSTSFGYTSGGWPGAIDIIDKFPFSVDGNATDVGDLTVARQYVRGQSSTTHGYTSGGGDPANVNIIDKFPFSVDANASDVGDLLFALTSGTGHSSTTSGYYAGGPGPSFPEVRDIIQKFPFATDANATDVGDLLQLTRFASGQSSSANGYVVGGSPPPGGTNVIQKFPFATDANSADVGDITTSRTGMTGQQV